MSCHPLLESDDAIFHILKGVPQEVKEETTSPHKSLLFHEVNQKEVWRTGRLSVHSLPHGLQVCVCVFLNTSSQIEALQHPCWLSCPPKNVSIFITAQSVCQVRLNRQGFLKLFRLSYKIWLKYISNTLISWLAWLCNAIRYCKIINISTAVLWIMEVYSDKISK